MDQYLAQLIAPAAREWEEVPMLLKKYYKDDRVFIRIRGILPPEQLVLLRAEMQLLLPEMEQCRADPLLCIRPNVPTVRGAS